MKIAGYGGFVLVLFLLIGGRSVQANDEGDALGALKAAVVDPEGKLKDWDTNLVDPCTWFHITCDGDGYVVRIDLQVSSLRGNLVPELGKLQRLQYLELNDNLLTGSIPPELGNLKKLISLDLYDNYLSGRIPDSLDGLSELRFMRLNSNRLSGSIPQSLTTLSNLLVLDVADNQLTGPVPGDFNPNMSSLSVHGNDGLCGPLTGKECS